jgi:hypothetical protein
MHGCIVACLCYAPLTHLTPSEGPCLKQHFLSFTSSNSVLQGAIEFVEYVFNDKANQDNTVNKTAIALLGDLASSLTGAPRLGAGSCPACGKKNPSTLLVEL